MTADPTLPSSNHRGNGPSKAWVRFQRAAVRIWERQRLDHVIYLAASLAYFTVLALVPISAISLSVIGAFFSKEQDAIFDMVTDAVLPFDEDLLVVKPNRPEPPIPGVEEVIGVGTSVPSASDVLNGVGSAASGLTGEATGVVRLAEAENGSREGAVRLTELHDKFKEQLSGFVLGAKGLGPTGLIFLIITGLWLFESIEDAFNSIWRVEKRRPFVRRFIVFWSVLTLTPLLLVGPVILNRYIETRDFQLDLDFFWGIVSFLLTWFAIWLLYLLVPNGNVSLRPAAIGSFVVALLWEICKRLFAEYVVRSDSYTTIYGSISLILIVLGWIYLTWWLILEGLELAAYLEFPDWDKTMPYGDLAQEICLLYSWGGLYHVGKNFLKGEGGTSSDSVSESLGLDPARVNRLLDRMEQRGILVRNRDGDWYPAVALEHITWAEIAAKLEYEVGSSDISLSEWLDSALRARGLVGYRQETENLPTLDYLIKDRMDSPVLSPSRIEEARSPELVLETQSESPSEDS